MKEIKIYSGDVALVDDDDFDYLNQFKWHKDTYGYAYRYINKANNGEQSVMGGIQTAMHREILHTPKGLETDHIDHNLLNNQKSNLRICTTSQNQGNQKIRKDSTTKFKGVCYRKNRNKFFARIVFQGKSIYLGSGDNKEDVARIYDKKAKELFGEFVCLNFPAEALDKVER